MNFANLKEVNFDDLIPKTKYFIQDITNKSGQLYGIFDRIYINDNNTKIGATFSIVCNFKNPITNETLVSGMGTGPFEYTYHHKWFIFYEPLLLRYNRQQNQIMKEWMESITKDEYLARDVEKENYLSFTK